MQNSTSLRASARRHPHIQIPQGLPAGNGDRPTIVMPGGGAVPLSYFGGAGNGFTGAEQSTSRGYIYFPNLDTRHEINTLNRTEILRKVRFLYNNDGFVKRCIDGLSRMIGYHVPRPATPDREWNTMAKRAALDIARSPMRFDRSGKYNFFSGQIALSRLRIKDGDALPVATLSDSGSTQVAIYEAHQVGNNVPRGDTDNETWLDGVQVDRFGKHRAYRLVDPANRRRAKIIQASQGHMFARYERPGQPRGMSACAHLVNDAVDLRELKEDMTKGMKSRQLMGFYLAATSSDAPFPASKGMQNRLKKYREANGDDPSNPDDPTAENLTYEEIFNAGNIFRAEDYEPKVLESAQPHENEIAFLDWKIRMMSLGLDIPPELLWAIGSLNGNTQRWLGEDAQEMLDMIRMETVIPFCQWWWFHAIGAEIASGRLREPVIPEDQQNHIGWWTVDWIPPRNKTIDKGRDGKLRMEEHRAMLTTMDNLYSDTQRDWFTETDEWIDEIDSIAARMAAKGWPEERIEAAIAKFLAPPPGTGTYDMVSSNPEIATPDIEVEEIEK